MGVCDAVTGAGGFSGRAIAARLRARGREVVNITSRAPQADVLSDYTRVVPFWFDNPGAWEASLEGVDTVYNTYWIRFPWAGVSFEDAVRNVGMMLAAARRAGVRRIVHISITNPSLDSPYPYFRGKAALEERVRDCGLSWFILRPAVIFGPGDILINNLGWFLRRFPVFSIPGDGRYRVRPVFVDDLADAAVAAGVGDEVGTVDAVGPRSYTFQELVRAVADAVGKRPRLAFWPRRRVSAALAVLNRIVGDVILTPDELGALEDGLLDSDAPAVGSTDLAVWLAASGGDVGRRYASEIKRHYRRG